MKKTLLIAITLVLTLFLTIIMANAQAPQDIAKTALDSTVRLTMYNRSLGSGFFVSRDHIVTSYSVIIGASRVYASGVLQEKNYLIVGIAAIDDDNDLVILKVSGSAGISLPVGNSDTVKERDTIYIVGNSVEEKGLVTMGEIRERIDRWRGIRVRGAEPKKEFLIDTANSPGDTGGPVLNDKGEVIGIFKGLVRDGDNLNKNLNAAIPSKYLKTLLEEIAKARPQRFLRPLDVKGVIGTHLTFGTDSYEFTLSNQRNETIYNPYCLIIFKDETGKIICADQFVFGGMMFAGRSKRVPRRFISKATDHFHYPYRPEDKPIHRPGVLNVSLVGASVKKLMQSYEIIILDFDIDTAFPSQKTPLEGDR